MPHKRLFSILMATGALLALWFISGCAAPLIVIESATAIITVPVEAVPAIAAVLGP